MRQQTWFVTGASKGLGLSLVKNLLAAGHKVAATSRNPDELTKNVGNTTGKFLSLKMDLIDESNVKATVERAVKEFGSIDVLVNNAGYGHFGAIEELSDQEARANFDANVFGLLNVTRNVLPYMREKRSGHIFNISSIGGYAGNFPGVGIYCATKFAVSGLSEALAVEVAPFGINVTLVYPGYFRTNFLDKNSMVKPKNPIAAYENAKGVVDQHADSINNNQQGDPEKASAAFIRVASLSEPPFHLFLGPDAVEMAQEKISVVQKEIGKWKEISVSTSF